MKGKQFLLISALTFILFCTGYFIAVDRLAIFDRQIPFTYRQFLLEISSDISGKIVIESGSNSLHSFDAMMIEQYFNRPTITLGDNAGYPIRHKLHNIEPHLNAGDILVLPLEWGYYIRSDDFPENYVDGILSRHGALSVYYKNLPLDEKIPFIFGSVSLRKSFESIVSGNGLFKPNKQITASYGKSHLRSLKIFTGNDLFRSKNGNSRKNSVPSKNVKISTASCDQFLFSGLVDPARNRHPEYFFDDLRAIKNLSERSGITVYFSWPTVVKSENNLPCYGRLYNSHIKDVQNTVIKQLEKEGFRFIDHPQDNVFSSACYLNTHYHIKQQCQKERTEKLIADLYSAGLRKANLNELNNGRKAMNSKLDDYDVVMSEMYEPIIKGGKYTVDDIHTAIRFPSGWSSIEKHGVWSIGKTSKMAVNFGDDSAHIMKTTGWYSGEKEITKVWIGGHYLGEHDLSNSSIDIPDNVGPGEVLIAITYKNPMSPKELGKSDDKRKLKFFLTSLLFE